MLRATAMSLQRALVDAVVYYYMLNPHGALPSWLPYAGALAAQRPLARTIISIYVLINSFIDTYVRPGFHCFGTPLTLLFGFLNIRPLIDHPAEALPQSGKKDL